MDAALKVTLINTRVDLDLAEIRKAIPWSLRSLPSVACSRDWLEFTRRGATKLAGVRALARRMGVSRSEILAVGDQENDLSLIRWAGLGVYVDNAPDELKRSARLVAPPSEDCGVAWVLERFVVANRGG